MRFLVYIKGHPQGEYVIAVTRERRCLLLFTHFLLCLSDAMPKGHDLRLLRSFLTNKKRVIIIHFESRPKVKLLKSEITLRQDKKY